MVTVQQGGPQASRGFTLIEMSIVLVIIGLIVGGILKGQEIVNAAREKQVVNQLNAVRTGQNTYIDRHGQYPGDDTKGKFVSGYATNGNGDTLVGASSSTPIGTVASNVVSNVIQQSTEEGGYFLEMLAEGLIHGAVPPTSTANASAFGVERSSWLPNTAFPNTGLGISAGSHVGNSAVDVSSPITKGTNWLAIWSFIYANNGGVSLRQAGHIDVALDDGNPTTGLVRGENNKCNSATGTGYASGTGGATTTENVVDPTCILMINMGPN